jgi:hypothetical protein
VHLKLVWRELPLAILTASEAAISRSPQVEEEQAISEPLRSLELEMTQTRVKKKHERDQERDLKIEVMALVEVVLVISGLPPRTQRID